MASISLDVGIFLARYAVAATLVGAVVGFAGHDLRVERSFVRGLAAAYVGMGAALVPVSVAVSVLWFEGRNYENPGPAAALALPFLLATLMNLATMSVALRFLMRVDWPRAIAGAVMLAPIQLLSFIGAAILLNVVAAVRL